MRAIIGFSMGAQQAFQWAVSHPDFADRIVATSGTAKTYGHGIVRLEGQIAALTADPTFNNGDYTSPPKKGIEAFGMVWSAWLYSQEWWRRELWKANAPRRHDARAVPAELPHQLSRRRRRQRHHSAGAHMGEARRRHDAGLQWRRRERAAVHQGSVSLHAVGNGLYFPVGDARYEAQFMSTVTLVPIPSLWGHPAGAGANPEDRDFLNQTISAFLAGGRAVTKP